MSRQPPLLLVGSNKEMWRRHFCYKMFDLLHLLDIYRYDSSVLPIIVNLSSRIQYVED